jgi:hypothetical protein
MPDPRCPLRKRGERPDGRLNPDPASLDVTLPTTYSTTMISTIPIITCGMPLVGSGRKQISA